MNMGLHDSFNLTWKMALVYHGIAPKAILETYEAERKVRINGSDFSSSVFVVVCMETNVLAMYFFLACGR